MHHGCHALHLSVPYYIHDYTSKLVFATARCKFYRQQQGMLCLTTLNKPLVHISAEQQQFATACTAESSQDHVPRQRLLPSKSQKVGKELGVIHSPSRRRSLGTGGQQHRGTAASHGENAVHGSQKGRAKHHGVPFVEGRYDAG